MYLTVCTPIGFVRLFSVTGSLVTKPQVRSHSHSFIFSMQTLLSHRQKYPKSLGLAKREIFLTGSSNRVRSGSAEFIFGRFLDIYRPSLISHQGRLSELKFVSGFLVSELFSMLSVSVLFRGGIFFQLFSFISSLGI